MQVHVRVSRSALCVYCHWKDTTRDRLTPALVLRLRDAARERRRGDVAVVRVAGRRGLPDDDLLRGHAGRDDLEHRRLRPRRRRRLQQVRARRVLRRALCSRARVTMD